MVPAHLPLLLHAPALPAVLLLFGLLYCLAFAHFAQLPWSRVATATWYVFLLSWVSVLLWQRRATLGRIGAIDILFAAFVTLLLVGGVIAVANETNAAQNYFAYLPFLVIGPYLCGRMMREADSGLLMRFTLMAGVAILPLLLLDRFVSLGREFGRWPFFGHDHGALLVGALLAAALIGLCVYVLDGKRLGIRRRILLFSLVGLMTVFLVWVMARGWLIAGLAGVAVVSLSARQRAAAIRFGLLAFVLGVTVLSLTILPSNGFYSALLTTPTPTPTPAFAGPILGEASCQPFREGLNSVAMRWVLYQEAVAMFLEHPFSGVGAARFGERSCTGPGGFPHSTLLQAFAELGVIGGMVFSGLLAMAALTFARPVLAAREDDVRPTRAFLLALFAAFLVADQIYGNYFMSVGMWLLVGVAASLHANQMQESNHG